MTEKLKPTPGPWCVSTKYGEKDAIKHEAGLIAFCATPRSVDETRGHAESWLEMRERTQHERIAVEGEKFANALFIAEAGTVFHECGLSPRELLEGYRDMYMELREIAQYPENDTVEMRRIARAALAKHKEV